MRIALCLLVQLVFEPKIISDHGDKLAICGLSSVILDSISEIGIERINVTSIPRDLDGIEVEPVRACQGE